MGQKTKLFNIILDYIHRYIHKKIILLCEHKQTPLLERFHWGQLDFAPEAASSLGLVWHRSWV
ncbi:hypothetical protein DKP78_14565 [Enterococcus faecium]|nr:hypothetical protein DKP78_14565 [Enterococcus faecium]